MCDKGVIETRSSGWLRFPVGRLLADKLTGRPLDKEHFNYREEMACPGATFTILPDVWHQTSNNINLTRFARVLSWNIVRKTVQVHVPTQQKHLQ